MRNILIVDNERKINDLLTRLLSREGFDVQQAFTGQQAMKEIDKDPAEVVLCDVKLPDISGIELCRKIREKSPFTEVILLTAYGNIQDGIQAMKNGAFDYLLKGDDNDKIIPLIHRAFEKISLSRKLSRLEAQMGVQNSFDDIIAHSPAIQQCIAYARKVAPTDTAVLLHGETGTGKEVFARAIHQASMRSGRSFIALNCAAIPKELMESELFGHAAGAFTGAAKAKKGLIEEADQGTLFLDEIGELPLEMQAKLLRVLEYGEYVRLGDHRMSKVNVRLITATNRNLQEEISKGRFREDLYYRISTFQIYLPPLRERKEDIIPLAEHFIAYFSKKLNKNIEQVDQSFLESLQRYSWKGNIRELKNIVERSIIIDDDHVLSKDDLPPDMTIPIDQPLTASPLSAFDLASAEKIHIQKVLNYTKGNKTEAARLLNIALTTLYRKIEQYHIDAD